MTVSVNGVSDSSTTLSISSSPALITEIIPQSASPVIKGFITLKISGFSGTLNKNDFEVKLVSTTDSNNFKLLNVVEVGNDPADMYVKVKYGGAYSGIYNVVIVSSSYGSFDSSSVTFEAIGKVTDYTPK